MKKLLLLTTAAAMSFGMSAHAQLSGTYSISGDPDNQAVHNVDGTYTLVSSSGSYSWVDFTLNQPVTFSQLSSLDAVFTSTTSAGGGAPRLVIGLSDGGDINVLLGTSPNFTDDSASLNSYSGVNLIGNNDTGRYDTSNDGAAGGSPYTTYSDALAQAGNLEVTDIAFVLDGGATTPTGQSVVLDSIDASAVPEPSTIFAGALLLLPIGVGAVRHFRKQPTA